MEDRSRAPNVLISIQLPVPARAIYAAAAVHLGTFAKSSSGWTGPLDTFDTSLGLSIDDDRWRRFCVRQTIFTAHCRLNAFNHRCHATTAEQS